MELLIVISVIALLMAVMLPGLNRANKTARSLACKSAIRSTGLAFDVYCRSNDGILPLAYTYISPGGISEQPTEPLNGISHWSGIFIESGYAVENSMRCPEIKNGGLPPQNTVPENLEPGQENAFPGIIDKQAERCAFTVNEGLCPRNRFDTGYQNAQTASKLVKVSRVLRPAKVILLTEWPKDWRIVSSRFSDISRSYMPVHGFRTLGQVPGPDRYDLNMVSEETYRACFESGAFRRLDKYDLSVNPNDYRQYPSRLDWVGRNHLGSVGKKNMKQSSFYYLDGHVESKSVYETIENGRFEWGDKVYSIKGVNSVVCY